MSRPAGTAGAQGPELKPELVMDTGPLSHLAKAGWLSIARYVADGAEVVIPDVVEAELRDGVHKWPHLQTVLDATWIGRRVLSSPAEVTSFAEFSEKLVGLDGRNAGEASVLAYAKIHGAIAVIDDGAGRKAGEKANVRLRGTLGLLLEAVRQQRLTAEMASDVADHLVETQYRLPFRPGQFVSWAQQHGLL